jgi:anion transporter
MDPAAITLLLLLLALVLFVSEKIPLALTSMIVCIALILTGVLTPAQGFAGFVSSTVILLAGMFVVGGALFETGMANEIGGMITKLPFIKTERQIMVAVMVISSAMSAFLSNTGTAAVLIPIIVGISAKSGIAPSKLLLPMACIITVAGTLSLIGTPSNMIAHVALKEATGVGFGFFEYGLVSLPLVIIAILYFAIFGYKLLPDRTPVETFDHVTDYSHVPSWKRWFSLGLLLGTVFVMIFEAQIGIPLHIASSIGAILLVLAGVINEKQAYKAIDSRVIFLLGGTLALGTALEVSGAGKILANAVIGLLGDNASPLALLAAILIIAAILTQFMSITATTVLLVPINLSIVEVMQAEPRAAMAATVIGVSLALLTPIATPHNIMIYSVAGLKFSDYVKIGFPLFILMLVVSFTLLLIFFPFY